MAVAVATSMPESGKSSTLIPLASPAARGSKYCLSFTAAGLRPDLAALIADIHLEEKGDWDRTKRMVLERNALQARSATTAKRLESELRQRLQCLTPSQLKLLALGSTDERTAMAWLAVLKRIQIAADLVRQVLHEKLMSLDPVLRRSDMAVFYEVSEREHPELAGLAVSSQQKVRSALLQMLRDAGLLAGKAGKGGMLGTVQRPQVSPQVHDLVMDDDPALLEGFLLHPVAQSTQVGRARTSAKKLSKSRRKTG